MELLAPAGNLECALAAFDEGADIVASPFKFRSPWNTYSIAKRGTFVNRWIVYNTQNHFKTSHVWSRQMGRPTKRYDKESLCRCYP